MNAMDNVPNLHFNQVLASIAKSHTRDLSACSPRISSRTTKSAGEALNRAFVVDFLLDRRSTRDNERGMANWLAESIDRCRS